MTDIILSLFDNNLELAFLISLSLSIIIAIAGVIPSFFVTAANLLFFGLYQGIVISFFGEALGAIIAFILYRKGLKEYSIKTFNNYPVVRKLLLLDGRSAFLSVLSLRLIPFVPSGIITFGAAIGKIPLGLFAISSSIGKLPALILEGYSVYQIITFSLLGKIILSILAILFIIYIFRTPLKK